MSSVNFLKSCIKGYPEVEGENSCESDQIESGYESFKNHVMYFTFLLSCFFLELCWFLAFFLRLEILNPLLCLRMMMLIMKILASLKIWSIWTSSNREFISVMIIHQSVLCVHHVTRLVPCFPEIHQSTFF